MQLHLLKAAYIYIYIIHYIIVCYKLCIKLANIFIIDYHNTYYPNWLIIGFLYNTSLLSFLTSQGGVFKCLVFCD